MSDALVGDVDRVARLLGGNDLAGATSAAAALGGAAHELARAAIALFRRDPEAALACADRARDGGGSLAEQYRATALMLLGRTDDAIAAARAAVTLDGGTRARSTLGGMLLASGATEEAQRVLQSVVTDAPHDRDARHNLAAAAFKQADYGTAMLEYARAFDLDPSDRRPIHRLMEMFAEMGKWLGAIAALELAKKGEPPPEVGVALDLTMLELIGIVAEKYPPANIDREADATVGRLVSNATKRGVKLQLVVARSLIDIERVGEAKKLLATIAGREQVERDAVGQAKSGGRENVIVASAGELTPEDRGNLYYVEGLIAERERDAKRALEKYERALAADPTRVDAAVNATSLLLELGTPDAFKRIGTLVTEVAPLARAGSPELLFNEAIYHLRDERQADGRARLEQLLELTGGVGNVAELARGALAELLPS